MKVFGTILCLATIAISAALGSSSALFCKHETGNGHIVSKAAHATEKHGQWCGSADGSHASDSGCDSCTDTQLGSPNSLEDLAPATDRSLVKAPLIADFFFAAALLEVPSSRSAPSFKPARAPPDAAPSARDFFTETVQLLI